MKVSIITATYNSEKTVRDTLESVAAQSYEDIEHIFFDGQSQDRTLAIVKEYRHVAKIKSENDNGLYDAMNRGLAMATGDIIGILNSDDVYMDSKVISDVVEVFQKYEVDCVYADLEYVAEDDLSNVVRSWRSGEYEKDSFLRGWMPPHPTFFVRKEVYERHGKFRQDMGSAADYELMLRFLYKEKCRCAYLGRTIVKMRTGGVSNASLKNRWRANQMDRKAWIINGLEPAWYTLYMKPLRKIKQWWS